MVLLNNEPVPSLTTVVKNGDIISHKLHRHEPPVTSQPIGILHEDDEMIVLDKPAGVPVHPAGRYLHNSIVEIMRAERGQDFKPMPCNRLDRLTSGVMFIGKTARAATELGIEIRSRTVRKEYVARVKGRFPDGEILCDQPILSISPILGLNRARASGKSARTRFRRLAYYNPKAQSQSPSGMENSTEDDSNEGYSIVHCMPLTGRTHQLRVHLQYLGHPITNDPIYSNRRVFGPDLARADASADHDDEIVARLSRMGKTETASTIEKPNQDTSTSTPTATQTEEDDVKAQYNEILADYNKRKGEKMSGELCAVCQTELYTDPSADELGIHLHAVAYSAVSGAWSYRSQMPKWALPPTVTVTSDGAGGTWPLELPEWKVHGTGDVIGEREDAIRANLEGVQRVGDGGGDVDGDEAMRVLVEGMGVVDLGGRIAESAPMDPAEVEARLAKDKALYPEKYRGDKNKKARAEEKKARKLERQEEKKRVKELRKLEREGSNGEKKSGEETQDVSLDTSIQEISKDQ